MKTREIKHNKKILVFGGSGFFGSRFIELRPQNWNVFSTYLSNPLNAAGIVEFQADLMDAKKCLKLIETIRPDVILHAAKSKSFDSDINKYKSVFKEIILKVKELNIDFVYISTDAVFDGNKGDYKEDDATNPVSGYGLGKKMAEKSIMEMLDNFTIIRTSYIYGKSRGKLDKRTENLLEELKQEKIISRFSDMIRSVTFVDDLVHATWKLIEKRFRGTLHISGDVLNIYDFSRIIAKNFGYNPGMIISNSIQDASDKLAPNTSLNTEKAERMIGFKSTPLNKFFPENVSR